MITNTYQIINWNVVTFDNIRKYPVIYIIPDISLIEQAKKNNYFLYCNIKNTGIEYDTDNNIPCWVDEVYIDNKKYLIVTLYSEWLGYPKTNNLGEISFLIDSDPLKEQNIQNSPNSENDQSEEDKYNKKFWWIPLIGIIIFLVLLYIFLNSI